jgi:hypothetical protein
MTNCTYTTPGGYQLTLCLKNLMTSDEINSAQHSDDFLSFNVTYWGTIRGAQRQMEPDIIVSLLAVDLPMTLVTYHSKNVTTMMPIPTLMECSVYYCEKQYSPSSYFLGQQGNFLINVLNTPSLIPNYDEPKSLDEGDFGVAELRSPNRTTKLSENSSYYIDWATTVGLTSALQEMLNFTY